MVWVLPTQTKQRELRSKLSSKNTSTKKLSRRLLGCNSIKAYFSSNISGQYGLSTAF